VRTIIDRPSHPYTVGLMASIPRTSGRRGRLQQIDGSMPRLTAIPPGCPFNPRCPQVFDRCRVERPELMPAKETQAACWLYADNNPGQSANASFEASLARGTSG
jgi:peptide/nickel transport system ATP-binding protein